jgi:DNA helicase-2/ATP-dependent DNA helicase PcrA
MRLRLCFGGNRGLVPQKICGKRKKVSGYTMIDKSKLIADIERVKGIKHSVEQLAVLNSTGGLVIIAGAGSGKTSTITELAYIRAKTGELEPSKTLCATYSKSGAHEMQRKFKRLCSELGDDFELSFKTLHSCYYQILRYLGYPINICSEGRAMGYLRQALKDCGIKSKDKELVEYLKNLFSYQINKAMSYNDLSQHYQFDEKRISLEDYKRVNTQYKQLKANDSVMEYDDMQFMVYCIFCGVSGAELTQKVLSFCRSQWKYFILDEFQDTSTIQYKILRCMCPTENSANLIVIGDDEQAIYTWRGTDPKIILEDVQVDYRLSLYVLSTNYRCKSNIVKFAFNSVKNLSYRQKKELNANTDGGSIKILSSDNTLYGISEAVLKYVKERIASGEKADKIAVLVRNNYEACVLNAMLYENGIFTDTTSESMRFTRQGLYADVKSAFELLSNTYNGDRVSEVLWKYVVFLGANGAKVIGSIMNDFGVSLTEALGIALSLTAYSSKVGKVGEEIPRGYRDTLAAKIYAMGRDTVWGLYQLYSLLSAKISNEDKFSGLMAILYEGVRYIYGTPERERLLSGYLSYVRSLFGRFNTIDRLKEYFSALYQYETAVDKGSDCINVYTYHGAKGLEWDTVILMCCDSLALPESRSIRDMVNRGYESKDIVEYIDCERRLYYVGCTRAKERLVIACDNSEPSQFLMESLGLNDAYRDSNLELIEDSDFNLAAKERLPRYLSVVESWRKSDEEDSESV